MGEQQLGDEVARHFRLFLVFLLPRCGDIAAVSLRGAKQAVCLFAASNLYSTKHFRLIIKERKELHIYFRLYLSYSFRTEKLNFTLCFRQPLGIGQIVAWQNDL